MIFKMLSQVGIERDILFNIETRAEEIFYQIIDGNNRLGSKLLKKNLTYKHCLKIGFAELIW